MILSKRALASMFVLLACGQEVAIDEADYATSDTSAAIKGTKGSSDAGVPSVGGGLGVKACPGRPGGRTQVDASIRVDQYKGVRSGANGLHEIFEGTIVNVYGAITPSDIDTHNVEVAMNVASSKDPHGLPHEVVLSAGSVVELVGEFIPARQTTTRNANGSAAVIHFTHSPCGEALLNGTLYQ